MPDYRGAATQVARQYGVPPAIFLSLVQHESGFNPNAKSPAGALGLTQLMPGTARGLGVNPLNPMQNLAGGARYLATQYRNFGRWDMALAAYNAGPGAVQKYHGVPPYAETQAYVRNVLGGRSGGGSPMATPVVGGPSAVPAAPGAQQAFIQQIGQALMAHGREREQMTLGAVQGLRTMLSSANTQASQLGQYSQLAPQGEPVDTGGMNPDFAKKLAMLMAAVKRAGGNLSVTSGYRSVAKQTQLWNDAVAKYGSESAARKWVAPPGHSNHNKGIAADLGGSLELAHKLAAQFGLYFPMSWEAWHIEPVGSR